MQEECARWAIETATLGGDEPSARERPRRRDVRGAGGGARAADDEEEYAHLPAAGRPPAPLPAASRPPAPPAPLVPLSAESRADKLMETVADGTSSGRRGATAAQEAPNSVALCSGRVVSRGSGATPLALLPPRRRAGSPSAPTVPVAPTLAAADIMRLPIVFADDEAVEEPAASPVTVTSGSRYTRVIVASRGARGGVRASRGGVRSARPVLLRRGLRLLPRAARPQPPH